ncbi:hypothetical protein [Aquibium oceanicum]|uniref:Uncharacterized protein n=1 Tax=Aquibium oceanicum TaxID=1670800 RepID=A0A1L3SR29_9HYPH|nr:hypothetical protein [Aquibium oceanicum]APH71821.1 hypothetical protein BSQ44_10900 [Aquibium oceanicum]
MEQYKPKYVQYLSKILDGVDPGDEAQIEAGYDRLRAANEKMLDNNKHLSETGQAEELRAAVEAVIRDHRESRMGMPAAETLPEEAPVQSNRAEPVADGKNRSTRALPVVAGVVIGLALGAAGLGALAAASVVDISYGDRARIRTVLYDEFRTSTPAFESARSFLDVAEAGVKRLQAENAARLTKLAGGKFIPIGRIDANLQKQAPKNLPEGTRILVRANKEAYKVIVHGPFCRYAYVFAPELIDPKRVKDGLNCTAFGRWNEAGLKF